MKKQVKLKDVAIYSKGKQINGDTLILDGEFDYLNGGVNPSGKWNEFNTSPNTVTISEGGNSSGYVNFMSNPFWCGAHCYYLYNLKTGPRYLYYALKSQEVRLMNLRTGSAMPNIKKSVLGNFVFNIDNDKNEQEKIVKVLDELSMMINLKSQQLIEYDQLIKSRFVEMFGTLNNTRFEIMTLMNLSEFITDGTHQTPKYTDDSNVGYKFLSSKDVTSGKIDWSKIKYIPEELHKQLYSRIAPRRNDLLLAKNGTTGTAALVDVDEVFDIYVSLAIIRLKDNFINPIYTLYAINSIDTKRQFNASLKGVGVPNLHLGEIRKAKIIVPPIEIQKQFVVFAKQVDKLKLAVQKSLDEAQILFDSLMQEYFG